MKKKMLGIMALGLLAVGLGIGFSSHSPLLGVNAADSTSDTSTTEVVETSVSTTEDDESFFWDAYNTYLVPILGTVSVVSIGSAVLSIAVMIFNRRANKKQNEENTQKIHDALVVVDNSVLILTALSTSVKTILEAVENGNISFEQAKKLFDDSTKSQLDAIAKLTIKTEEVIKLKPVIITLAEIQGKLALGSKEMVASGIGDSINKLVEQVKSL